MTNCSNSSGAEAAAGTLCEEMFDVYDSDGNVVAVAPRRRCHGDPSLLHRTAHVAVFHADGRLLLQKRGADKDIQPGKWDTAVGGHLGCGENYLQGALRELREELGVAAEPSELEFLFESSIRNTVESEDVGVFKLNRSEGFEFDRGEISEIRFWTSEELFDRANAERFTPNLLCELGKLRERGLI